MRKTNQMELRISLANLYIVLIALLFAICTSDIVFGATQNPPGAINVTAGNTYLSTISTTFFETLRWSGIKVIHNTIQLSEGTLPFLTSTVTTPNIIEAAFPGPNHNDLYHYYIATQDSVFNISKMKNISYADLQAYAMFNQSDYPIFYTNFTTDVNNHTYYSKSDNPNATFCCNLTTILIGNLNVSVYKINLSYNYNYYLGKYNFNGKDVPMFIAPHEEYFCYNSTTCYAQFVMPISPTINWNFFSINKYGAYTFDVSVDGINTTIINETAKPYNVTLRAYNLYTGAISPNLDVTIGEHDGQNIFVPYRLSGFVSTSFSIGRTNSQGYETFIGAPSVYPPTSNYSIFVSALFDGHIISQQDMSVAIANRLSFGSKGVSPQSVYDNAKTSVNAMNQIVSFLYRWVSVREEAKSINIVYDIGYKNYTANRQPGNYSDVELQTGIPHIINLTILNFTNTTPLTYYGLIHESGGYLVVNPYTDLSPLTNTQKNKEWRFPTNTSILVVPSSLGSISSNITIDIIDSHQILYGTINTTVNPLLSISGSGVSYKNDLLKTIVNSMNQVIYSLYVALNT